MTAFARSSASCSIRSAWVASAWTRASGKSCLLPGRHVTVEAEDTAARASGKAAPELGEEEVAPGGLSVGPAFGT
eukprot:11474004-Alexandrium_andersonii.AAC.1